MNASPLIDVWTTQTVLRRARESEALRLCLDPAVTVETAAEYIERMGPVYPEICGIHRAGLPTAGPEHDALTAAMRRANYAAVCRLAEMPLPDPNALGGVPSAVEWCDTIRRQVDAIDAHAAAEYKPTVDRVRRAYLVECITTTRANLLTTDTPGASS